MEFQDYYKTLGVDKQASDAEIKKAYKKLARKFHPDLNKEAGAEDKFKRISEAYEVLKDPEKRSQYDTLGQNYKNGQGFRPPPGWEQQFSGGRGGFRASGSDFSDFFEMFFGGGSGGSPFGAGFSGAGQQARARKGQDLEAEIELSISDLYNGGSREVSFLMREQDAAGNITQKKKSYRVKIPPGTTTGSIIRLGGQGGQGLNGGKAGDLKLKVKLLNDPRYKLNGVNLESEVLVTPWEAALGAKINVETPKGKVTLNVPKGTQSGQKLRLKGLGVKKSKDSNGDLFVKVLISTPKELSDKERELFEKLAQVSDFNPRS